MHSRLELISTLFVRPLGGGRPFVMKTYVATPLTRERNWLVVDATGQTLGRLATQIAEVLRGTWTSLPGLKASRTRPRSSATP